MLDRLCYLKEALLCAIEAQISNLDKVDTTELGEAIDMIKDLEEAIYYCTVTKAMEEYPSEPDRMYYHERRRRKTPEHEPDDWPEDEYEGRSRHNRRMYMEAKEHGRDKATQLRELEKYMQELSSDITEMIADATIEEKSYLEKKINALANKVGSMK